MAKTIIVASEKDLVPIKARVTKMQAVVSALVVEDEDGVMEASKILTGIKDVQRKIKTYKDARIKPINDALRLLRADLKPIEEHCAENEKIVKDKVITYNTELEKIHREAEAKLAERVEKGTMKIETAARKMEEVSEVTTHISTEKGSMTIKKVKKFRVVDLSLLPLRFHLANEVAIRQRMNAGQSDLPGVEYYEEDQVSAR